MAPFRARKSADIFGCMSAVSSRLLEAQTHRQCEIVPAIGADARDGAESGNA